MSFRNRRTQWRGVQQDIWLISTTTYFNLILTPDHLAVNHSHTLQTKLFYQIKDIPWLMIWLLFRRNSIPPWSIQRLSSDLLCVCVWYTSSCWVLSCLARRWDDSSSTPRLLRLPLFHYSVLQITFMSPEHPNIVHVSCGYEPALQQSSGVIMWPQV